ncbi:MAG: universal stress protein [Coleofasciculaceae cyanobacterium SM2_3_26]|nr:universal stress protein [Coleofasciculaceae cyanobacterium SM2_3_26]
MFKTILFPIDRSRESREAAEFVVNLVKTCQSRLILLSVLEEAKSDTATEGMDSEEAVTELLTSARAMFAEQQVDAEIIERRGKPSFVICDVADEVEASLIVMGCRGLGLMEDAQSESVSHRVIDFSPCPVLVVP